MKSQKPHTEKRRMGHPASERNAREGGGKTHSHLFLRGLLPRPWGCGNGLKSMGSEIWQSCDFCLAGGVGRQDYCRVKIGRGTRRIGKEGPTLSKQQARKVGHARKRQSQNRFTALRLCHPPI